MAGLAIVGRIPGYNANIDSTHEFEQELKKGITYVDLFPTAYTDTAGMADAVRAASGGQIGVDISSTIDFFGKALSALFTSPGMVVSKPPGNSGNQTSGSDASDPSLQRFKGILTRMQASFGIDQSFTDIDGLRIIAANDSTFTETFTNSFDADNPVVSTFNTAKGFVNKVPFASQMLKGMKSLDTEAMYDLVGGAYKNINQSTGKQTLADLLSGAALGMNIAAPQIWSASQYNSTLTMFVKLVSPTGHEDCIRRNILEPLLYLIAAASPITSYGTVYGYPLMWQVHAHGITNFRVGSIAALSIIRGSFETTFTKALQPTVVDVRLTIIPLLSDFAVQTNANNTPSIYEDAMAPFLGVQNPADIVRGTMNKGPVGRGKDFSEIVSVKI